MRRLSTKAEKGRQCFRGSYNGGNQADLNLHLRILLSGPGEKRWPSLLALPILTAYRPFIILLPFSRCIAGPERSCGGHKDHQGESHEILDQGTSIRSGAEIIGNNSCFSLTVINSCRRSAYRELSLLKAGRDGRQPYEFPSLVSK